MLGAHNKKKLGFGRAEATLGRAGPDGARQAPDPGHGHPGPSNNKALLSF